MLADIQQTHGMKALGLRIADLNLNSDFSTATLVDRKYLDEMREVIEERICYVMDAIERDPDLDLKSLRKGYKEHLRGLKDCRKQILMRQREGDLDGEEEMRFVSDYGIYAYVAAQSFERIDKIMKGRQIDPKLTTEIAIDFHSSNDSSKFLSETAIDFASRLNVPHEWLPSLKDIRDEVRSSLKAVRTYVLKNMRAA